MEHIDSVNNPIISVVENQGAEVVFAMQFFQILFIFFLADMVRYPALLTSLVGREQSREGEPEIPKSAPELKSHYYSLHALSDQILGKNQLDKQTVLS